MGERLKPAQADDLIARLKTAKGADEFMKAMDTAMKGASYLPSEAGSRSVRRRAITRKHDLPPESDLEVLRGLSLKELDKRASGRARTDIFAAGLTGAASGAVAGGGTVLLAAGSVFGAGAGAAPGAGVVISALAGDAAATLALTHRVVAKMAAFYGYDTRLPDEELFALTVVGFAAAGFASSKSGATAPISQLVQAMARRQTWGELNKNVVTKVVREVYGRLGLKLTQKKLGQVVPVVGVGLGAAMNVGGVALAASRAQQAYRARHLLELYGREALDAAAGVVAKPEVVVDDVAVVEDAIAEVTALPNVVLTGDDDGQAIGQKS